MGGLTPACPCIFTPTLTLQAGIDRYNLSSVDRTHLIVEWQLKHLPFSLTNAEIGVTGKVNRSVIMARYASKIENMFNEEVTVRKSSRELTYIQEEEEEKLAEIPVKTDTTTMEEVEEEEEEETATENVTIVNVEREETGREKEGHDRHVRFTSTVETIEINEIDLGGNEKTS